MTIEKNYNPKEIEKKCYENWENSNNFAPKGEGEGYCIVLPPPNVTGSLHMGHAFQDTIMDALIRYKRMQGKKTLWQVGTDHAGIATQMVVERLLQKDNVSRHDLGREKFVEKIWDWKKQSGNKISNQLRRLGASADWSRERFTMDEGLSKAVTKTFVDLYNEGLIYKGKRLVNWDVQLQTAVSDLEVESIETNGSLWHIKYPIGNEFLTIATTRPETMLGDMALAVNPEDERYEKLVGKKVTLPLMDREIPIIADEYVDKEFGTGVVKITPAHDFNDYEVGKRHNLEMMNILTKDGKINSNGKQYEGLERFEARKKILADLEEKGLLEKIEDHKLKVPKCDRTGEVVEPFLTDQWFVKIKPLAEPAIEAVKSGQIKFVPQNWEKTYFDWMYKIEDWCISRQIWWGHRIPAWYDDSGKVYVAQTEQEAREKYNLGDIALKQETDVLDTWFSSALWPFSTLGWPEKTPEMEDFYSTDVLVTGFDIIFFWVARMIMFGLKFAKGVPFKEVYIHGLIQDQNGDKMSKSKGNVLDPLDLIDGVDLNTLLEKRTFGMMQPQLAKKIEKNTKKEFPEGIKAHGTDALRFTFFAIATHNRHIRFEMPRLEGYRNFCNKIWNAARYVQMNIEGTDLNQEYELSISDKWILSKLQNVIQSVNKHFENYRFDLIANELYEFVWNEYCDWYLELSKPVLSLNNKLSIGARKTLVSVLNTILKLLHPIMPFVTEELWQKFNSTSIMTEQYPEVDNELLDQKAEDDLTWIKGFVTGVRNIRGEMNISPKKQVSVFLNKSSALDIKRKEEYGDFVKSLANIDNIDFLTENVPSATALVGDMEILIPIAGLIDKGEEVKRLQKEILKLEKDIEKASSRLQNENYVNKAPAAVVNKEREAMQHNQSSLQTLKDKLEVMENL